MTFAILATLMMCASAQYLNANAQVSSDFNIAAAGDWGCNEHTEETVSDMQSIRPEMVIGLGDYSYSDSVNCWLEIVRPIDEKMKIAIGNHDHDRSSELQDLMGHFGMSRQYYGFSYQNVRVIVMSTELSYSADSEQYNFVESELESAASNSSVDWIIVAMHKQAYASPTSGLHTYAILRDAYHSLFDQYGVDLVLQAHAHSYERSYPIKYNPSDSSMPTITDTAREIYNDPEGVIYASIGTAGAPLDDLDGKRSYIEDQHEGYGFLDIRFENNGQTMKGRFYDDNGSTQDRFTITK